MKKKLPKTRRPQIVHDRSLPIISLAIGSQGYHLALAQGPLMQGRKRVASLLDSEGRRILVSLEVPATARMEVAAIAICEAWKRETIQRPPLRFVGSVE